MIALCPCGHFQSIHEDWRPLLGQASAVFGCDHCGMSHPQTVAEATVGGSRLWQELKETTDFLEGICIGEGPAAAAFTAQQLARVASARSVLKGEAPAKDDPDPDTENATLARFRDLAGWHLDAVKHCRDKMNPEEQAADKRLRNTPPNKWTVGDMNTIITASRRINNLI